MSKYKVIEAYEIPAIEAVEAVEAVEASEGVEAVVAVAAVEGKEAVSHQVGDILELTDEQAVELEGKVEKVEEPKAPTPPATPSAPVEQAPSEGWAGNHVVGANKPEKGRGR